MNLKQFKTYTIDDDTHTYGYTIIFPIEDVKKVKRGGMLGTYIQFLGWLFYPAHAGGQAIEREKFGIQDVEFEDAEDITSIRWDMNEWTDNEQKESMIKEVFKYYRNK